MTADKLPRLYAIDCAKFIMAFAVIVIHVQAAFYNGSIYPPFVNWFIRLAVPFFFISSGFLVARKLSATTTGEGKSYLRSKAQNFLRLFFYWLLIYLPLSITENVHESGSIAHFFVQYIGNVVLFGSSSWAWALWYLYASFWAFLILSLFKDLRNALPWIGLFFLLAYIAGDNYTAFIHGKYPAMLCDGLFNRILGGGIYIVLGMYIYLFSEQIMKAWSSAACLVLSLLLFNFVPGNMYVVFGGTALFILASIVKLSEKSIYPILNSQSMWIFYLHMEVIAIVYFCHADGIINTENPYIVLGTVSVATYLLSAAIDVLSRKVRRFYPLKKLIS